MHEIEVTNNMIRTVKKSLTTARICNNLLIIGVKYSMFLNIFIYVHVFVSCDLQLLRSRLIELTKDLEELGVTQEQLKECVSPVDMKTMNQKVWLLWQGQGDLDHHLAILCHQLEEKLGMRTMFDNR
jgi:hypothetical protein